MTRFALTIEFDGGPYMGWQWQDHGPSVQGTIEEAIFKTTGEKTLVYSAGRTDAGVHALGMRAHVDVEKGLSAFRLSCIGRAYAYRILNRRASLTLERGRVWRVGSELDADAMNDAAQILVGLHDFTTFRSTACQAASPVKKLDRLTVRREGQHVIIEAAALSFLHHQVRSMVGCLVAVGLGRWNAADLKAALDAADRSALAENAPPEGLYFVHATYP